MAHRQFSDSAGVEWVAYDVVPRPDDRRSTPRRQADDSVPPGPERRVGDRRAAVGGSRSIRLTQGWLCFERSGERRRLQPIPPKWHLMPEEELAQLLEQAVPALQRKRRDDGAGSRRA